MDKPLTRMAAAACLLILTLLPASALADLSPLSPGASALVGGATYITADPNASAPATLWLAAVSGTSAINGGEPSYIVLSDGQTLPINGASLSGVTFAVVALTAWGEEKPYPDPSNPTRPWIVSVDALPEPLLLPTEPPLYLRQLTAPEGYSMITDLIPLTNSTPFGETLTIANQLSGGIVSISSNEAITFTLADPTDASPASGSISPGKPWIGVLPSGEYQFTPELPPGYVPIAPYIITALGGGISNLSVDCEPMPLLAIRVQSAAFTLSGEKTLTPVVGETITLTAPDGSTIRMLTDATGLARRADQNVSDHPAALPGEYTIRAGREPERSILLESGQTFAWDILTHDGTGQLRLTTQSHEAASAIAPLGGVSVSIHGGASAGGGSSLSRALTTGDAGGVWLSDLPEGAYTLELTDAPTGYTALTRLADFEIHGGEETTLTLEFTKDALLNVERLGRVIDGGGAVSLTDLPGDYTILDASGNTIGAAAASGVALPAAQDGTTYTLVESEPADGFQPDPTTHTITLYPGDTATLETFADSALGLFSLAHQDPSGGAIVGGAFELASLDTPDQPSIQFTLENSSYYNAPQPIQPGRYLLTLTEAANGYMADPSRQAVSREITIEPYLRGDGTTAVTHPQAVFTSEPIPEGALNPAAPALILSESTLDLSAERETRLTIIPADQPLPASNIEFTIGMTAESGVSLSGITIPAADGITTARVSVGDGVNWTDAGTSTLPTSIRWDDVRDSARFARITLTGDKPFTLDDLTLEATIRALPRLAVDSAVTLSVSTRVETPVQTAADKWRVVEGKSSQNTRVELVTPRRQSQGSVFEDPDMDRIRGLNDTGVPLVRVTARDASGGVIAETTTDADGAFAFNRQVPSNATLTLSFDELHERTSARYAVLGQSGWRFAVLPESSLAGTVTVPASMPQNAYTDIYITLRRDGEPDAQTAADESGAFRIGGLTPGKYEVVLTLPTGYLPSGFPVNVEIPYGETLSLELAAQEAASLSGQVKKLGLAPSVEARTSVVLEDASGAAVYQTTVSDDGWFLLKNIEPNKYTLLWNLPDAAALEADTPSSETITLRSGENLSRNITIVPGASISGTILDHAGEALTNITARLTRPDGTTSTAVSDSGGAFAFDGLAAGAYTIEPSLPDGMILYSGITSFDLTVGGDARAEWIAFVPASVSGTVWLASDGGGSPLPGVTVTAIDAQGNELLSTTTNQDGIFLFSMLRPTVTRLRVAAPNDMTLTQSSDAALGETLTLEPGQSAAVGRVEMVRVAAVEAFVWQDRNDNGQQDAADQPLAGVSVTLLKDGEPIDELQTNERGVAVFERVRPGEYLIESSVPAGFAPPLGYNQPLWSMIVGYDSITVQPQLPLTPLADLVGTARRSDGEPATGLGIRVETAAGQFIAETLSNENGSFTLERLRPGDYIITYNLPASGWAFEETDARSVTRAFTVSDDPRGLTAPPLAALGILAGAAYTDTNGDGSWGDDEPGVAGAAFTIRDGAGSTVAEAVTDRNGKFIIEELRPGAYSVVADWPDGLMPSIDAQPWGVTLSMGGSMTIGDIAAYKPASIVGIILNEMDSPLPGASLTLFRSDTPVGSATTGEDGAFGFSDVKPGIYSLTVTLPDGYLFTNTINSDPITFNLRSGERLKLDTIGAIRSASISGLVWLDTVYDGMPGTDEPPLPGVMVTLLDASGSAVRQARTSENGGYTMESLFPGEYRLHAALPDGLIFTKPELQFEGGSVMPLTGGRQAFSGAFTLEPGQSLAQCGAGAVEPGALTIEAYVDANADGQRGPGEQPLADVAVTLTDEFGITASASTGGDGRYRFESLRPGTYALAYVWPGDYVSVSVVEEATLAMGESRDDPRSGATLLGSVSGEVFEDMDADGLRGADEPGLAGVTVTARTDHGDFTIETGEDGSYLIEGLLPGAVTARFTLPDGMMFTRQTSGGSMAETTDGGESSSPTLTLAMGGSLPGVSAGATRSGTVGDYAWIDHNLNGMQDSGEPGMQGVTLTLERGSDGQWIPVAETVTDADGFYEFEGVRPGTYRISVNAPEGFIPTRRADGVPEINSKLRFRMEQPMATDLVIVESNQRARNADIGFARYEDARAAGWRVQGGGEITLP
ncbi:MAG: carboxypeptidase regulatory-like domain-containing protein [Oscillospiraceae bacterium]|jgi:protocatechuate 3,4-dioxygenase beta subunit|nr:carboxypeptidase regulatory-like domain-containing protein [Oscillospiraceae bacterium]